MTGMESFEQRGKYFIVLLEVLGGQSSASIIRSKLSQFKSSIWYAHMHRHLHNVDYTLLCNCNREYLYSNTSNSYIVTGSNDVIAIVSYHNAKYLWEKEKGRGIFPVKMDVVNNAELKH